jgi:hypothetical protein
MGSTNLDAINEEAIFAADFREKEASSRKPVVLRKKIKASGKEKLANHARFKHRTAPGLRAKNYSRRNRLD